MFTGKQARFKHVEIDRGGSGQGAIILTDGPYETEMELVFTVSQQTNIYFRLGSEGECRFLALTEDIKRIRVIRAGPVGRLNDLSRWVGNSSYNRWKEAVVK